MEDVPSFEIDSRLRLDEQACFPVYALSRLITKTYQPLLERIGLTYPQYLVMMLVWEHREISVKEIGQKLYLDTGTLTPLLKLLEQKQLISRRRDPRDERSVLIGLLPSGRDLHEQARQIPEELAQRFSLKHDEVAILRRELTHLITLLS
ncbi:MarR family winged helix-turn-helix transcriptional regulator [Spirosoma pomorum]